MDTRVLAKLWELPDQAVMLFSQETGEFMGFTTVDVLIESESLGVTRVAE